MNPWAASWTAAGFTLTALDKPWQGLVAFCLAFISLWIMSGPPWKLRKVER